MLTRARCPSSAERSSPPRQPSSSRSTKSSASTGTVQLASATSEAAYPAPKLSTKATTMKTELRLTDTNAASDSKGRTWGLEGNLFWCLVGGGGAGLIVFFVLLVGLK